MPPPDRHRAHGAAQRRVGSWGARRRIPRGGRSRRRSTSRLETPRESDAPRGVTTRRAGRSPLSSTARSHRADGVEEPVAARILGPRDEALALELSIPACVASVTPSAASRVKPPAKTESRAERRRSSSPETRTTSRGSCGSCDAARRVSATVDVERPLERHEQPPSVRASSCEATSSIASGSRSSRSQTSRALRRPAARARDTARLRGREQRGRVRGGQGRQPEELLAAQAEPLAARDERRGATEPAGAGGGGPWRRRARARAVEHEQGPFLAAPGRAPEAIVRPRHRGAGRRDLRGHDLRRSSIASKPTQVTPSGKRRPAAGELDREAGLSDATRPDDREQPHVAGSDGPAAASSRSCSRPTNDDGGAGSEIGGLRAGSRAPGPARGSGAGARAAPVPVRRRTRCPASPAVEESLEPRPDAPSGTGRARGGPQPFPLGVVAGQRTQVGDHASVKTELQPRPPCGLRARRGARPRARPRASVSGLVVRRASGVGGATRRGLLPSGFQAAGRSGAAAVAPGDKSAEALEVELLGSSRGVADPAGEDRPRHAGAGDRGAEPRDVDGHRMARRRWRSLPHVMTSASVDTVRPRRAAGRPARHAPSRRPAGPARRHRRPRSVRAPENPPQPLAAVAFGRSMHRMSQGDHPWPVEPTQLNGC